LFQYIGTIALSPKKQDILKILYREDVCGDSWFWMDLFCIDQDDSPSNSISIADQLLAIPQVYKSSRCVKVLLEYPICEGWHAAALRVLSAQREGESVNVDVFKGEEIAHSRRCPHLLCFDPWFERLWTRQEGLYGASLDIVVLDPIPCRRFENKSSSYASRWVAEASGVEKRLGVESFLNDKMAYHGVELLTDERLFKLYTDLAYR
jgi:hypothetical protein